MPEPATPRRVVVMGPDADAVGREIGRRRDSGDRLAGFVGSDRELATAMADEMLGGCDEVVELPSSRDQPEG